MYSFHPWIAPGATLWMNACCEALLLKWRALKSVVEFSCGAAAALAAFGVAGAACLASVDCGV